MSFIKVPVKHLHAILVTRNKKNNKSTVDYDVKPLAKWEDSVTAKCVTRLQNTPHYKYLLNNKSTAYKKYLINGDIYVGHGIEHSFDTYKNLIKNFKGYPYENKYIRCQMNFDRFCITDGLHRANILLWKGVDKVTVFLENPQYLLNKLKIQKQIKLEKEKLRLQMEHLRVNVNNTIIKMNDHINLKSYETELLQLLRGTVGKQKYNAWVNSNKLQSGYHSYNTFGLDLQGQRNCSIRINNIMKNYSFDNKTVLDIGCNTGGMTFHIPNIGYGFGLDYDNNCIAFAKRLGELANKNKYHFETFDFDKRNLNDLHKIVNKKVDTIILCSMGSWVKKWEQLYQYCYNLKSDIIFETNNDTEGEPQLKFWRDNNMNIKLIINNSKDDITGNNRRKTYLLTHE